MSRNRIAVLLMSAALAAFFYVNDFSRFLDLAYIKSMHAVFVSWFRMHPVQTILVYSFVYVVSTALSLPGAVFLTIAGGAVFGLVCGTLIVSVSSTLGATLAFLVSRYVLRDLVQKRFGERLKAVNEGIENEGAFYLFSLRLVPLFPFFVVNLLMGLTPIRTSTYFWTSQVGMLPATVVFVNAGTEIARIDSAGDIMSFGLAASFAMLGLLPLASKKLLSIARKRSRLCTDGKSGMNILK